MSKRKIQEAEVVTAHPLRTPKRVRIQNEILEGELSQAKTALFAALRISRGFERQKLGRRQKQSLEKKKGGNIARLESEVRALKARISTRAKTKSLTILKALELENLAEIYLYRTLCKIKSIAEAQDLPPSIRDRVEAASHQSHDTAYANVTSRLFISNPVKEALESCLQSIRKALGIEETTGKKKRLRKADYERMKADDDLVGRSREAQEVVLHSGAEDGGGTSKPAEGHGDLAERLASESADEEFESGTSLEEDGLERNSSLSPAETNGSRKVSKDYSAGNADNISDIDASTSENETMSAKRLNRATRANTATARPKSTTFFPTLMGGYISGSEIESEDEAAANIDAPKNRPGQQARRAKWERKYGENANHIKKAKQSRDAGWDPRRGAQADGDQRGRRGSRRIGTGAKSSRSKGRGPQSSGANADAVVLRPQAKKKAKDNEGKLHPSWEAAKKRKEQHKDSATFAGKKVKFD
ncbi:MAG: hypothetical protein MMC23_001345 [Stictis urceolatum]|nr:hypothetical protein [Stictis urceolata]